MRQATIGSVASNRGVEKPIGKPAAGNKFGEIIKTL